MTKKSKGENLLDAILRSASLASTRAPRQNAGTASLFKFSPEEVIRIELEEKLDAINRRHQEEIEELRAKHRSLGNVHKKYARRPIDARTMAISFLKSKYPRVSQRELCAKLDVRTERNAARGPLPSWKKKTWVDAYDDPKTRPKLKVYISKR